MHAADIQVEATLGMRMWRTHGEFGEYFARLQRPILQTLGVIDRDTIEGVGGDEEIGEPSRLDSDLDDELYSPLASDNRSESSFEDG
jgi:hypothetical protein